MISTLEKHRCYGTGPICRKIGGRVVYALADLQSWADRGVKSSASDPGCGTVHHIVQERRDETTVDKATGVGVGLADLNSKDEGIALGPAIDRLPRRGKRAAPCVGLEAWRRFKGHAVPQTLLLDT